MKIHFPKREVSFVSARGTRLNAQPRNAGFPSALHSQRGLTLIECLVYISVLFVVLGVAYKASDQFVGNSLDLRRNAADIVHALQAGERWRADVRAATGPLRLEVFEGDEVLEIPQTAGTVLYQFARGNVWRAQSKQERWILLLSKVKNSRIQFDQGQKVRSVRWEVELKSRHEPAKVRPLFSFQSIPAIQASR
ncbi:MAG: prepilin-type N-terminal cleavage/methylation domain-containing protein [Verrucomicrobia bacterium]|nr:prepilin-type N-terminal cleavage/methylation domain-containing protein [Verrucomicrobiota bacterium]